MRNKEWFHTHVTFGHLKVTVSQSMCLIIMLQTWYIIAQYIHVSRHFKIFLQCPRTDILPADLNPIVLSDVSGESGDDIELKCVRVECTIFSFDSFEKLKVHLKRHLSKSEEVLCPFHGCSKAFKVNSTFTAHLSRKHHNMDVRSLSSACINQNT